MKGKKALIGLASTLLVLTACGNDGKEGVYTYNTWNTVSPSNWNELTYQDNNDTDILGFISGGFFSYNFEFDDTGKPIDGAYVIEYDGLTKIEDVSADYVGEEWGIAEGSTNRAFKLTLRDDLKWDDGTPIHGEDFVYSMKELLNPLFRNYRADTMYNGSTAIHNARDYVYQGSHEYVSNVTNPQGPSEEEYIPMSAFKTGTGEFEGLYGYEDGDGVFHDMKLKLGDGGAWGASINDYAAEKLTVDGQPWGHYKNLLDAADKNGELLLTESLTNDLIYCIARMNFEQFADVEASDGEAAALEGYYAYSDGRGYFDGYGKVEWQEMAFVGITFPELDFEKVGMFCGEEPGSNEVTVILDLPLELLDSNGDLTYHCAYDFGSLPLVKKDLYEANKVAPKGNSKLWTTKYNTSVDSTASWGPYKLTKFQKGKAYQLEKNPMWYGWNMETYTGEDKPVQYQTDIIHGEILKNWNTAWLKFQKGNLTSIGIDVSIADDYKNSDRAIFTADDFVSSLQLQSSVASLKEREAKKSGTDKEILGNVKFRQAISLSIDRTDYTQKCTTASKPGLGLFNSMHYLDVANAGVYRDYDAAKRAIVSAYGTDMSSYTSLDEAYEATTGYNMTLAKKLVDEAYEEELAKGTISATDVVELDFGTATATDSWMRMYNFLDESLKNMCKNTKLDGRIKTVYSEHSDAWATDFRAGGYDICTGGWTGAAWNPGYMLSAYLDPAVAYSSAWDPSKTTAIVDFSEEFVAYIMEEENNEYLDWIYTLFSYGYVSDNSGLQFDGSKGIFLVQLPLWSQLNGSDAGSGLSWYNLLNGITSSFFGVPELAMTEGVVKAETRAKMVGAVEEAILKQYYTVPISNSFSASLLSYKVEYITTTYNTFMGYGGIRYMTYNYDDHFWNEVKSEADYKASSAE